MDCLYPKTLKKHRLLFTNDVTIFEALDCISWIIYFYFGQTMKNEKINHLKFNEPAPDIELLNVESLPVRLSSLW